MHFYLCHIYFEFLFISFKAFLPSFKVLKTSQEIDEIIKTVSIIKEKKVVLIGLSIKLKTFGI